MNMVKFYIWTYSDNNGSENFPAPFPPWAVMKSCHVSNGVHKLLSPKTPSQEETLSKTDNEEWRFNKAHHDETHNIQACLKKDKQFFPLINRMKSAQWASYKENLT